MPRLDVVKPSVGFRGKSRMVGDLPITLRLAEKLEEVKIAKVQKLTPLPPTASNLISRIQART